MNVTKSKEILKKCPGLKKIKEAGQVDPTHCLGCSLVIKDTSQTTGKNLDKVHRMKY